MKVLLAEREIELIRARRSGREKAIVYRSRYIVAAIRSGW